MSWMKSILSLLTGNSKNTEHIILANAIPINLPDVEETKMIQNEPRLEDPKMKEIMEDPIGACEKYEKLRNLLSKQDPSMMQFFDKETKNGPSVYEPSTDLGSIDLESKIKISPFDVTSNIIKVMMIGKSGCGQTSLLGYLTENSQLKGADTMFAQTFEANAFNIKVGDVGLEIKLIESPGMCGGMELDELGDYWKELVKTINDTGGIGIFMLLIKSNERLISEFFEELQAFSTLFVEDTANFLKRTIVIFTSIDELKDCNTYEASVERLQKQIAAKGMEKLKNIIDQTKGGPLFVSNVRIDEKKIFLQNLSEAISLMIETKTKDPKQTSGNGIILKENHLKSVPFTNENSDIESIPCENNPEFTTKDIEISEADSELYFFEEFSREQLLHLLKEICQVESCCEVCNEIHMRNFQNELKLKPPKTSKRKKKRNRKKSPK